MQPERVLYRQGFFASIVRPGSRVLEDFEFDLTKVETSAGFSLDEGTWQARAVYLSTRTLMELYLAPYGAILTSAQTYPGKPILGVVQSIPKNAQGFTQRFPFYAPVVHNDWVNVDLTGGVFKVGLFTANSARVKAKAFFGNVFLYVEFRRIV